MEIKNIQRNERKSIRINIMIYPSISKWMKENNISPTALFDEASKEMMEQGNK